MLGLQATAEDLGDGDINELGYAGAEKVAAEEGDLGRVQSNPIQSKSNQGQGNAVQCTSKPLQFESTLSSPPPPNAQTHPNPKRCTPKIGSRAYLMRHDYVEHADAYDPKCF